MVMVNWVEPHEDKALRPLRGKWGAGAAAPDGVWGALTNFLLRPSPGRTENRR